MILVDTSVWIDHFRKSDARLVGLLEKEEVIVHPFVLGELACGNLKQRKEVISLLHALPSAPRVEDDEILFFIEERKLSGHGVGLIDIHLLASSLIGRHKFWTKDKRLKAIAGTMKVAFRP